MKSYLTIAVPKGRLGEEAIKKMDIHHVIDQNSRKLIFVDEIDHIKYLIVKPVDVITYVENKVCDLGIIGKDSIMETQADVYELLDLGFGKCKFAVAGFKQNAYQLKNDLVRIATKYPNVTKKYFEDKPYKIKIIKLNGSVELAPLVGLSDVIVDIVETGSTLKANGLEVIEDMMDITAKLICNVSSYRFNKVAIHNIMNRLSSEEKND